MTTTPPATSADTVKALYAAFAAKDTDAIRRLFHPDIEWIQLPGFPGGHHRGVDDVLAHSFTRLRTEWTDWRAVVHEWIDAGATVVAIGVYTATNNATGKPMEAAFAHVYDLQDGRIRRLRQYTDTLMVDRAARAD